MLFYDFMFLILKILKKKLLLKILKNYNKLQINLII